MSVNKLEGKSHTFYPDGRLSTLVFPLRSPESVIIDGSLLPETEIAEINTALTEMFIPQDQEGSFTIDNLNESCVYHDPTFDRIRVYIDNHIRMRLLQKEDHYSPKRVAGCDVGFYNALVMAEAISLKDGLILIQAEQDCISKAWAIPFHNPEMKPYLDPLIEVLDEEINIKEASINVIAPSGKIIKAPKEIREEILNQTLIPADDEHLKQILREKGLKKALTTGLQIAKDNPGLIGAIGALGILAFVYKVTQERKKR
ncbi:MAG: hypothetical protein HYW86_05250 [Candidatus Roizmanbacteria bacterium]|nr:MAG: hypothetical protein HYW86_05250 [Candidatus Roizmanbacteria bacterium]